MKSFIQGVVDGYIIFLFFEGLLLFSLIRNGKKSRKKMLAVLIMTLASAVIWTVYYLISVGQLSNKMAFIVPAGLLALGIIFHRVVFPYKGHCTNCGKRLSITEFLFNDDHLCHACYEKLCPETIKLSWEEAIRQENEEKKKSWINWTPDREYVIAFAFDKNSNVLLIDRVKMAKVPGKLSGIIGEIRSGEKLINAASRAIFEQSGLECAEPQYMARLNFDMPDKNIRFHVFVAREFSGTLKENAEKNPIWLPLKKLKYQQMSMDYPLWLPRVLRGNSLEYFGKCNTEGRIYDDILDLEAKIF